MIDYTSVSRPFAHLPLEQFENCHIPLDRIKFFLYIYIIDIIEFIHAKIVIGIKQTK